MLVIRIESVYVCGQVCFICTVNNVYLPSFSAFTISADKFLQRKPFRYVVMFHNLILLSPGSLYIILLRGCGSEGEQLLFHGQVVGCFSGSITGSLLSLIGVSLGGDTIRSM